MPKAYAQLISPPQGIQNPEEGFGPDEPWPDTYAGQVSSEYVSLHKRIRESPAYGRYWHVQTTSLELAMTSSEGLYISFPPENGGGQLTRLTFERTEGTYTATGTLEFIRVVAPENCFQQYLVGISSTSDGLSGYFSFDNQAYLLRPAGLGRSVIYEFIPPQQMTESCSACDNIGSLSISSPLVTGVGNHGEFSSGILSVKDVGKIKVDKTIAGEGGACVIDLAVGFTPEAADFLDIKAEAAAIVAQMNHALVCSKVTNFCYRLAGCDRLDFLEDRGTQFNVSDILDQITPPSPTLPDILAFRSDNNADQVLIVKTDNLEPGFGVSQVRTTPSDRWRSVIIDGSIARFTPSHELAHNHGCQHLEDAIAGGDGELNIWARSHLVNATSTTIMSQFFQLPSGQMRTFNFSNPDQFNWLWEPTGLSDRDNAQQLRSTGCDIADLVDSFNPEWSQTLRIRPMDPNTCPGDITSFRVTDRCLNSTIGTISWSWSINGSAYQHLQTTSSGTITAPAVDRI